MPHVQTVLGPVSPANLGRVMPHEHLFSLVPGAWLSGGDGDHSVDLAAGALATIPALGFGTVVDLSPYGVVGRDADGTNVGALVELSERSGLHIVAGSAVYLESFSPEWARRADIDALTQRFIDDATTGIGDTGILAGIYGEQATSLGEITPHEEKCLRAVARAHSVTGLAIATHTTHATMAMEQVKILQSESVALDRVVIGHMDTSADETEVYDVLEAGAHIAIDTIGKQVWEFFLGPAPAEREQGEFSSRKYFRADARRADFVARLVQQGWVDRILLAQDLTGAEIWMNPDTHGAQGYSYLAQTFIPLLRARGVSEEDCEQMLRGNPARVLTIEATTATQEATL